MTNSLQECSRYSIFSPPCLIRTNQCRNIVSNLDRSTTINLNIVLWVVLKAHSVNDHRHKHCVLGGIKNSFC